MEDFPQANEIGGYRILEELVANESWRAFAPGNRQIVLKRLDPDCLLWGGSKLHPSIRDRLARVRELAHARIANLHGVERDPAWDEEAAYLVWEYVEGETLEDWAVKEEVSAADLLLLARELILTVEALHARGIVHGAIHGRNVIIDPAGRLRLTHVSPLLYTEPRNDLDSIAALFHDLSVLRGEADSPLDRLADEASESEGLQALSAQADVLIDSRRDEMREELERAADVRRRRVSRGAAAVVVLGALILTYGVKHATNGRWNHLPPSPPRAPAAAMSP